MATAYLPAFEASPMPPTELPEERIAFLHPGYDGPANELLLLPRVDRGASPASDTIGVHHRTALVACQIIAGNAFESGHFALDQQGEQTVDVDLDGILTEKCYYFMVGDGPSMSLPPLNIKQITHKHLPLGKYPVVPSFRDWEFPHGRIPDSWPDISGTTSPDRRRCAISNFSFSLEPAHLVPAEEAAWYARNAMFTYGAGSRSIDNQANMLNLISHIHRAFDNRWLAIVPKVSGVSSTPQYVSHILSSDATELWPTSQNKLVQYTRRLSRPYLFARFAWSVLLSVKHFITSGFTRKVIRVHIEDNEGSESVKYKSVFVSGQQLVECYGDATQKKRKSRTESLDDDDESSMESFGEDNDIMAEWHDRDRKKKFQMSGEETAVGEEGQEYLVGELKERLLQSMPSQSTAHENPAR